MQEQKFEEKVRLKMDELSFIPSDPVWVKVEEEIKNRKEKRRFFLWLFPFLVVSGLVYYFIKNVAGSTALDNTAVTSSSKETKTYQNHGPKNVTPNSLLEKAKLRAGSGSQHSPISNRERSSKMGEIYKAFSHKNSPNRLNAGTISGQINDVERLLKAPLEPGKNKVPETVVDKNTIDTGIASKREYTTGAGLVDSIRITSALADSIHAPIVDTIATNNDVVQQKKHAKKRWIISISSSLGATGVSTSALAFSNGSKATVYQSAARDNFFTSSASFPNAPMSNLRSVVLDKGPSKIRSNLGFSAGIGLDKKINSRFGFSSGLQYTHFSTLTFIGRKVQSSFVSANNFYLNNSLGAKDYITRYHTIELPLSFNWQVMPQQPLKFYAGIAMRYLVSTNALQYDAAMNIYYKDKSLYRKTQISALTGFDYSVLKMGKNSLSLGPKLGFQLTNLLRSTVYGQQHLYFAGINTSFSF